MNWTELSRDQLDPVMAFHTFTGMGAISQRSLRQGRNVSVFGFERDRRCCAKRRQEV
jgi:hypothetical protein